MILVSILGDFHSSILPVFFDFKEKIKTHIIVYDDSKEDEKQCKQILCGQNNFLETFEDIERNIKLDFEIIPMKIKEDSYEDIIKCCDTIISKASHPSEIYLNTTDGLSSVSIVMSSKLLELGANVISYDKYANTYNLHSKNSMKKLHIKNNLDIKNHLRLKGYNLKKYTNKFSLENRKDIVKKLTKDLPRYKSFAKRYPNHHEKYSDFENFINDTNIQDSQKKFFVDGGVFEEYIYWLLKENFDFDDIMTGVTIEFNQGFINEIDILIIKDNHLHTIECKFTTKFKGSEYVYKTDSIMEHLDDDGKGMILTVGNKDHFTRGDKFRAFNNKIYLYAVDQFEEGDFIGVVREFFRV